MSDMVDMSIVPDDAGGMPEAVNIAAIPQYPYGLCICLNQGELEKLELDGDCEVGDYIHLHCFAKVTSVSKTEGNTRVELQITKMKVEDEGAEDEEADEEMDEIPRLGRRNPYKK